MKFINKNTSLLLLLVGLFQQAVAGPGVEGDAPEYSPHTSVQTGFYTLPKAENNNDSSQLEIEKGYTKSLNLVDKEKPQSKGLLGKDIKVSGVARFVTIGRSMNEYYDDMTTSPKHFSLSDYPNANANSGANAGYPMLELNLQSKVNNSLNFSVGYSFGHNMTGDIAGRSRNLGSVQNMNFKAHYKSEFWKASIWAGEVLWGKLSKLTMGQIAYRDNYFNRLPWDWYRKSYTRYQEYHSLSSNIGAQGGGGAPVQGAIGVLEYLPFKTNLKVVIGQTNRSAVASDQGTGFPSITQGYRLEKYFFERAAIGTAGLNLYAKRARASATSDFLDNNTMLTFDFNLKVKRILFEGEVGGSMLNIYDSLPEQPVYEINEGGFGAIIKASFDRRAVDIPFSLEFYNLDKNFGNVDGSIMNQNQHIKQGGVKNEFIYNDSYYANVSNEAGQLTNNRRGVNLDFEYSLGSYDDKFGGLKVQLGYSVSQEIEKVSDTLTIQHRVNSFSRSRFRPWFQAGGNYSRIQSNWFRTFETVTLDGLSGDYLEREKLGFNVVELALKYRKKINKNQELVLINLTTANTIKEGFNAFSVPGSDDNLVTVLYNDITAAYRINNKLSFVGNFAIEKTTGSDRVATEHLDPNDNEVTLTDYIDQLGHMYAIGVDYDISQKTSFHLRTKYMDHEDKNFTLDKFSGFETTFELKIFL